MNITVLNGKVTVYIDYRGDTCIVVSMRTRVCIHNWAMNLNFVLKYTHTFVLAIEK